MIIDEELKAQFSQFMQQLLSQGAIQAFGKRTLVPNAFYITGPASGVIPDTVKSFNIINLGLDGLGITFADVDVTGLGSIAVIKAALAVFGYSIENDQNQIQGGIEITPDTDHVVLIQFLQ